MSRAQWNGTLRLHRPDPSHRVFCYCSCKQDAEERFSGQQFCQMERDELMNWLDQLKWTTFKDGLKYFRSDWTEKVHSTWLLTEIYRYLSWIENSQVLFLSLKIDTVPYSLRIIVGRLLLLVNFYHNAIIVMYTSAGHLWHIIQAYLSIIGFTWGVRRTGPCWKRWK